MRVSQSIRPLLLWLCCATAATAGAADLLSLEAHEADNRYRIEASFIVEAPIEVVHGLLTDYERLPDLSPSILESELVSAPEPEPEPEPEREQARVRTRVRVCVLIHCQTLQRVEDVRVSPTRIVADIVPEQSDVKAGRTEWRLTPQQNAVRVDYRAELVPGVQLFPVIGPAVMKASIKRELRAFLGQLQTRAAQQPR